MGQGASAPTAESEEKTPGFVRLDRNEIPEEYRSVGVSDDVVRRVAGVEGRGGHPAAESLKRELERERAEKARLYTELTELQKRAGTVAPHQPTLQGTKLADDLEDRKRIFDETVERVQRQFFHYRRENACQDHETGIADCLRSSGKARALKCAHLSEAYEKCAAEFRNQVLQQGQ